MNTRIQQALTLAAQIENDLLIRAHDCVVSARQLNDERSRQTLFDEAAELRRIAEFAGAITRIMEFEAEDQRVKTRRELERRPRRSSFVRLRLIAGGGA